VFTACGKDGSLEIAKQLHSQMLNSGIQLDVQVQNALVSMYGKCGCLEDARAVFEAIPNNQRDIVAWNAMMTAYEQSGNGKEVLKLFQQLQQEGMIPNQVTWIIVITACGKAGSLEIAKQFHNQMLNSGIQLNIQLQTALISMHGKHGCLEDARAVFDEIPHSQKNIVTWNAMIAVFGSHGLGQQALELFKQLEETGLCPNEITFTALLNALSHSGMVDEGFQYFDSMQTQYSLIPTIEHQNCMVDLLGRSGQLERAEQFIINQVPNPNMITWMTLLGACRTHGDVERAERIAQHALQLDPSDASIYVLLFNTYAMAGRHDDAKRVRDLMRTEGVKKVPGISSISVKGKLHIFKTNESDHKDKRRNEVTSSKNQETRIQT
jgi:pentatricopeptide repeat protein